MSPDAETPVVAYLRVSTEEQGDSGAGLDGQDHAIRAACEARGWRIVATYREVASGKSAAKRPLLQEALTKVESGGAAALVVKNLDRLARSTPDASNIFARAERNGWGIVCLDIGIDTMSPVGKLIFDIMAAVGDWERRTISVRTKDALAQRRREGVTLGRPKATGPAAEASIAALHACRAAGLSLRATADQLNADGVPGLQGGKWHKRSVQLAERNHPKGDHARLTRCSRVK